MRFDENVESEDFMDIALSYDDIERILRNGIVKDFAEGINGKRSLNIYIHKQKEEKEICH